MKKPLPSATDGNPASRSRIEREENEDLEVDEGLPQSGTSKAEEGLAGNSRKIPAASRKWCAANPPMMCPIPEAVVEEMRNQDA